MFNHIFWNKYFKQNYVPQISNLIDSLVIRILPTFEGIEEEAEKKMNSEYERLLLLPSEGNIEISDLTELATEAGISHYALMKGIQQGIINMFAVALYHLFEQQVMEFHRKEVLQPSEENDKKLFEIKIFLERLSQSHVKIADFQSWKTIDELKLVANTVKHGEGQASKQLYV